MKKSLLLIFAVLTVLCCEAQVDDNYVYGDTGTKSKKTAQKKGFDWSRTTIGGGFGMTFGSVTIIDISPMFGYYLTDELLVGVRGTYTYYQEKFKNPYTGQEYKLNTNLYGGGVLAQYLFSDLPFIAHVELEVLNVEDFNDGSRVTIINPYVGGGLRQSIGGNSYMFVMGLWNLNETEESYALQPNPIIRAGIAIGL